MTKTYDSSALKVASNFYECQYFKDQDTLIEQSFILIEQPCLYSKPSSLTYSNTIAMSILKATSIYMLNFIHNNSLKYYLRASKIKFSSRPCIYNLFFFTFKTSPYSLTSIIVYEFMPSLPSKIACSSILHFLHSCTWVH